MNDDLRAFKRIGLILFTVLLLFIGSRAARAVIIEGFTDTGQFVSVQVSADGRLLVSQTTGVAQAVFFLSSQPVNAYQATTPWVVEQAVPIEISTASISNLAVVSLATSTTLTPFVKSVGSGISTLIFSADTTRRGSLLCNTDAFLNAWIGQSGVTPATGKLIPPGTCFSPDNPAVFQGALYAVSTHTLTMDGVVTTLP